MEGNDKTLKINISDKSDPQTKNKKKSFEYSNKEEFEIDIIKNLCIETFKYKEKDKNKIILYFVDEEGDKNIINNFDELLNFAKNVDDKNLTINLYSEIKTEEKNTMNEPHINNKINDNKGNNVNIAIHNNNNENDIIYIKNKEIEELKKKIYNLEKEKEYDFTRYKNLLFYYEEFIKPTKNEKGNKENKENDKKKIKNTNNEIIENNRNENVFNKNKDENKESKVNEKEKENNVKNNENDKKENNNKINDGLEENNFFKKSNTFVEGSNKKKNLQSSQNLRQSENLWDIDDDKNLKKQIQINYKEIELVYTKCLLCHKKCNNKIYKDYRGNKYICENCFKKKIKNSDYDNFFEIKFPPQLINYLDIKRKELGNKPVDGFNKVLNNIFFDNEGNFKTEEINKIDEKDFLELEKIYNDLRLINEDPIKYFADYQNAFINKQKVKFEDIKKKLIDEKLKLVVDNLLKLKNKINYWQL